MAHITATAITVIKVIDSGQSYIDDLIRREMELHSLLVDAIERGDVSEDDAQEIADKYQLVELQKRYGPDATLAMDTPRVRWYGDEEIEVW